MYSPQASFRNILSPVKAEDFFATDYRRKIRYIPGPLSKFSGLFDWRDLNQMLSFDKVWDSHNLKMVIDGDPIPPVQYCPNGVLDRAILSQFLDQGATLALTGCESLSDGSYALSKSIQAATGAVCGGNLYFSQKAHAGFRPHFDVMDVIVIQISGEKRWNIYQTQFENPVFKPGFHHMSFPRDYHEQNKGDVDAEITMTPGDVLYIPRGKYHAALAVSDASLHLTFGIEPAKGYDYLQALIDIVPTDPLFRQEIPHFEDVAAHQDYLARLADKMHQMMSDPELMAQMRDEQRRRAYDPVPSFSLPHPRRHSTYRVRVTGSKLVRRGKSWRLTTPFGQCELAENAVPIAEWALLSDLFSHDDLTAAFNDVDPQNLSAILDVLTQAGLIDVI